MSVRQLLMVLAGWVGLAACGTMSSYQKVSLPYRYTPLKPGTVVTPYFVAVEPATLENTALAGRIRFRNGSEAGGDEPALAPAAAEAKLLVKLVMSPLKVISALPEGQGVVVAGHVERTYRYQYQWPVTVRFYDSGRQLLWEHTYDALMEHTTGLQPGGASGPDQPIELALLKQEYFKYLHRELAGAFGRLFYHRQVTYDASVGESGPQKRMKAGNKFSVAALALCKAGGPEAAGDAWRNAIDQYESLIGDEAKRGNGAAKVSVREKAMAYYNCAQAYMWLQQYDQAQAMIRQGLHLCGQYASDSTHTSINSDRFMFPRLQREITLREESARAARATGTNP